MLFSWTPNFVPNKIFIFGCGGTGSRVVPLVAQFIKSCPWVVNPEVILIDFDNVEEKNLLRQNFITSDIGKNKAIVLANRYSKAFNVSITPLVEKIKVYSDSRNRGEISESEKKFGALLSENDARNNLFILCVDSPEARREILRSIIYHIGGNLQNLIIDAGNENDFGQVTLSSGNSMRKSAEVIARLTKLKNSTPESCKLKVLPLDSTYYDRMVAVSTPSCAELDQTMAINCLMATNIFSIIQNIYYVKPISFHRINVSLQHGAIPQHFNVEHFIKLTNQLQDGDVIGLNCGRVGFEEDMLHALMAQENFEHKMELERKRQLEEKIVAELALKDTCGKIEEIKAEDLPTITTKSVKKKKDVYSLANTANIINNTMGMQSLNMAIETLTP